jgi:hypothetical protein
LPYGRAARQAWYSFNVTVTGQIATAQDLKESQLTAFRLEKDGVYKSWAVPKGLPEVEGVNRLAVEVEDHDLAFGEFAGQIPDGQYGAGTVAFWDRGYYEQGVQAKRLIEGRKRRIPGCRWIANASVACAWPFTPWLASRFARFPTLRRSLRLSPTRG